jgi:hypothetical protein
MICSVIVLVGVALIGQTRAFPMDTYSMPEILMGCPRLSEELDRDQLIAELASADYNEWDTAITLCQAKNKASTVLYNGVRVTDLFAQDHIDLYGCSTDALNKRVDFYESLEAANVHENQGSVPDEAVVNSVALYVAALVEAAVDYCFEHKEQVVAAGINTEPWLMELGDVMFADANDVMDATGFTHDAEPLKQIIAFIRKSESGQVHL